MVGTLQRMTKRPFLILAAALVATALAAAVAAIVVVRSGDSGSQNVGGGGPPPPALQSAFESLPPYPGATVDQVAVSTGDDLRAFFWLPDQPQQAIDFYTRQLPAEGWRLDSPPSVVTSGKKDDGTQMTSVTATFVRDGVTLVVSVHPNTKTPSLGASHLVIEMR